MSDDPDASREYERLRAELADFVLQAVSEHVAAGNEPRLAKALADAIDRRVDEAVSARLAEVEWPDPQAIADAVVASLGGRSEPVASRRRSPARREPDPPARILTPRMIAAGVVGILLVAAATFLLLRGWSGPTNTVVMNAQTKQVETPPDANLLQPPLGNEAGNATGNQAANVLAPTP